MPSKQLLFIFVLFISCNNDYTPKPRALVKIELPIKEYTQLNIDCNFIFDIPVYSKLEKVSQECFYNLHFPDQNGILHITYLPLNNNLFDHTEEARRLAYKHNLTANSISEHLYINTEFKVYGVLYDFDGATATAAQFYLTDSVDHFFRGALYFSTGVSDSLLPVNNFLKEDIRQIVKSFRWKN